MWGGLVFFCMAFLGGGLGQVCGVVGWEVGGGMGEPGGGMWGGLLICVCGVWGRVLGGYWGVSAKGLLRH